MAAATLITFPRGAERSPAQHPTLVCECGGELEWREWSSPTGVPGEIWNEACWVCKRCGENWDEEPLQPGDVLSPTQVRCFQDCPARWRFKYVDRLPDPKTSSLALGIAVHEALAGNFSAKMVIGEDLPAGEVRERFRRAWAATTQTAEFRDDEDPKALGEGGEGLVGLFMEQAARAIQPARVEAPCDGTIAGVPVQGRVDILDTEGRIIDIKTAQRNPGELDPFQVFQLATYDRLTPGARGEARIYTLVRTATPQLLRHTRTLTAQDYRSVEVQYPLIQDAMQAGIYVPNRCSMLCSRRNCAFWRACEAEYGGEVPLS